MSGQVRVILYLEAARRFFAGWVRWYNEEHHHAGLALFTPAVVHFGEVSTRHAARQRTLDAAYQAHPERFVGGPPIARLPPAEVWINQPTSEPTDAR